MKVPFLNLDREAATLIGLGLMYDIEDQVAESLWYGGDD